MTLALYDEIWTDPSDGYTICVVLYPDSVETDDGDFVMGFSYHTGALWTEIPGQDHVGGQRKEIHIGPLVKTHGEFSEALLKRGLGPATHYLLGRRDGGYPLRIGSRVAVEALLAELKTQWQEYRRASNPEYRIKGLRAIRRARRARDPAKLAALKKRYPLAAAYEYKRMERLDKVKELASSVMGSIQAAPTKSSMAVQAGVGKVTSGARNAVDSVIPVMTTGARRAVHAAVPLANGLLATTQGLLASALSTDLNALLQDMVKGSASIYDKAMDAQYLATRVGGGNHRLFDGGHTVLGAFKAVRDASPDDTVIEEAMGFLEGMFRDMTTPKGLPLATWDPETFGQVADYLKSNFGIPKSWFYDINSYDASELIGGVIGVLAVALGWNRADTESFAKLVGGIGISAIVGANPLLLILTVVALARAFHKAHQTGTYAELIDGHLKGGIGAGASLAAASRVAVVGGPAGVALLVGLSAGILVNRATRKVSVAQIGRFVAERAAVAAKETKRMAAGYVGPAEASSRNVVG